MRKAISTLVIGCLLAALAIAPAWANQAGLYKGSYSYQGSRAHLTGSASIPNNGGVIASVRVQGNNQGLYQVGHTDLLFAVRYMSGNGYQANIGNNKVDGPYALGFANAVPFASAEYNGGAPNGYDFNWGPSGETPWQYYDPGSSQWNTVNVATKYNDGGWTVGDVPSPIHITR